MSALAGQKTLISRTMHALEYDPIEDELVVNSPLNNAILTFRGGAKGEEAPIRVIQGPRTQIQSTGYDGNDKMAMDSAHGEIYIPVATSGGAGKGVILVFDREANGDAPPKRILGGPDTGFQFPSARGTGFPYIGIDPMRNLLVISAGGSLLIFDRTASGNAKPRGVITGPKTGLAEGATAAGSNSIKISPKGYIVGGCAPRGSVCAWNIDDRGDAAPRWRIPVPQLAGVGLAGQLTLDPIHQTLVVPNGGRNVVMTFFWPEIFE